jgi:CPA2 family monovalent cation:H+ antiporter-2
MEEYGILLTLTSALSAALVLGYFARRLKLPPIFGYLLAGIIVGPFTPGYVAHQEIAKQFADIGVILLLFGIGLRFHLDELAIVWRIAVPGALIQSLFSTLLLSLLLHLLGWSWNTGIVLGLAISVSSTVVMSMILGEQRDLHAPIGHIAIGWTIMEDLLTVSYMLILPIIFSMNRMETSIGGTLLFIVLKFLGLIASVVILGRWVIPRILERIALDSSRELFTLAVLVLALGIAIGSTKVFGVSMGLGAFLAGLAVNRTEFAARAAGEALPMRDAFAVLFFVSIGMLFDPASLLKEPLLIAVVLFVVLIGKPISTLLTVRILGRPISIALPVGAALAQVGEFSFILVTVALELGLIESNGWHAMIAASMVSIALNPSLYRLAKRLSSASVKIGLFSGTPKSIDPHRCILVGYGPVGKTLHRILSESGKSVTVIDLNLNNVRLLKKEGYSAVHGDVLRRGTLEDAGILESGTFILGADIENAAEVIRQARVINPNLLILARCIHLRDVEALRKSGANHVAAGEVEVAVALAEAVNEIQEADHIKITEWRNAIRKHLYRN